MDWLTWGAPIFMGLVVALDLVLVSDAAYQIAYEKASFLRLEQALFKRVPTTPDDCLLQGAGKLLISIGILLIQVPGFLITLTNALGGLPPSDRWLKSAMGFALMTCAALAIFLFVSAANVLGRVHFTYLGRAVKQP